jgi:hypothetical protein
MAGGVAQVVKCLPSKCEILSSNPSATAKKTRTKQNNKKEVIIAFYPSQD